MSSEWAKFTDLLEAIVDNRGKTCPVGETGIPLIATNCVNGNQLYPDYNTSRFVSEETYKSWFRGHPKPGDILFVCKGSPGRTNWVPDPVDFCIAQDMVAVRANPSKVYPKYLFAVLRSDVVKNQIDNMHVGTMIPHFKKGDFDKLQIPMCDTTAQREIGDFYFVLSERIESLRETNATLEAIAQALFKSWFVDFDPVHANAGTQAPSLPPGIQALFPATFTDTAQGPIPEGWKVKQLGDVTAYLNRGISPKYVETGGVVVINQKCIRDFAVDLSKARRHDPIQRKIDGRILEMGDILVNSTGVGTLGRVAQLLEVTETMIIDSHVTAVRANSELSWPYLGLALMRKQPEIEAMGEGSTGQTELARAKLAMLPIVCPSEEVLKIFDDIVTPLKKTLAANATKAENLSALRDTLLPRLISGQLRLPEAEQAIAAITD